ncbi:MAG: hypothetical protein KAI24_06900 [Planctomycetes bacterium]|nr:hypothetical protein [Planctomycetota bacterium]
MTRASTTLLLALAGLATACNTPGPTLTIANPERERVYLDGRQVLHGREGLDPPPEARAADQDAQDRERALESVVELKFRYYGTTRWDVLPNVREDSGVPVFDELPNSAEVEITPPASPWLFPFDFPLEIVDRTLFGRRDREVVVAPKQKQPIGGEIPQDDLGKLSARARAARSAR